MLIRHPGEETLGQPPENAFVAYDSHRRFAGAAAVHESFNDIRFPDRPLRYRLEISCPPESFGTLAGAAMARAMQMRREQADVPARIYMECDPDDELRQTEAKKHGFTIDDELIRWRKSLQKAPITIALEDGYVAMRDTLADETERGYFCQRFERIMGVEDVYARSWVREKRALPRFQRLLVVNREGLAGEMTLWAENRVGEIGYIFVTPECRRRGVGSYLFEMARERLIADGIREAVIQVPRSMTALSRRAAGAGYRSVESVKLYAGINL